MALVYRATKGAPLSHAEMDNNFYELQNSPVFPKTKGVGIKVDLDVPTFGWRDITGIVDTRGTNANDPTPIAFNGNIRHYQFAVNNEVHTEFHIPHDYVPNSDLYIHAHWAHNSAAVTSGSVTWSFEVSYAKGHNQASFSTPTDTISVTQAASTSQRQHMIAETQLSSAGGVGGLLNTANIETDGIIDLRCYLSANTMNGGVLPFLLFIDLHYQSNNLATKQKAPDFWT